jgi:hypothetical protein
MGLCEVSIALPASGGATLTLWFRFVTFHMSYPDMVRQISLLSERLLKVHVLASDASGPDFWSANPASSDRRSIGALRLDGRFRSVLWLRCSGQRPYWHFCCGWRNSGGDVGLRHRYPGCLLHMKSVTLRSGQE